MANRRPSNRRTFQRAVLAVVLGVVVGAGGFFAARAATFTDQAPVPDNTFATLACFTGNSGFLNPAAQAADTGGDDGDGFELNPTNAYADGSGYATNENGPGDRHRYYDYSFSISPACAIEGIEVRLDWWLSTTLGTNSMDVELSWNGGTSWTTAKTDTEETTSEHTVVLGGASDTWGRTWSVSELSSANFRVRLTTNCSGTFCSLRDFYLDWVPVGVYYGPP